MTLALTSDVSGEVRIWSMAMPPKTPIQTKMINDGISRTQTINSRTVRPLETRAMNMPTKGAQDTHQAQ